MKPTNLGKGWVNASVALACLLGGTTIVATVAIAQNGPSVQTSGFPSPRESREEDYKWKPNWKWSNKHRYHFNWCHRDYFTDEHGRKYYVCYPDRPYSNQHHNDQGHNDQGHNDQGQNDQGQNN